jgi:hypothetical protein
METVSMRTKMNSSNIDSQPSPLRSERKAMTATLYVVVVSLMIAGIGKVISVVADLRDEIRYAQAAAEDARLMADEAKITAEDAQNTADEVQALYEEAISRIDDIER